MKHGVAGQRAAPCGVAPHDLIWLGSARPTWQLCRAITNDAADIYAAPYLMTLQKRVSSVKSFTKNLFLKFI
jgi:hypothetical protein